MRTKTSLDNFIAQLERLRDEVGGDTAVLVAGYEGGYDHVSGLNQNNFVYDPHPYCGDYETASYSDANQDEESFKGVVVY